MLGHKKADLVAAEEKQPVIVVDDNEEEQPPQRPSEAITDDELQRMGPEVLDKLIARLVGVRDEVVKELARRAALLCKQEEYCKQEEDEKEDEDEESKEKEEEGASASLSSLTVSEHDEAPLAGQVELVIEQKVYEVGQLARSGAETTDHADLTLTGTPITRRTSRAGRRRQRNEDDIEVV